MKKGETKYQDVCTSTKQRRNVHTSWMLLARAVIESALEDKDRNYFLSDKSTFPEFAELAELPKEDLAEYARKYL